MIYLTTEEDLNLNFKFACIYFYASWMPFHKRMSLMISRLEEKYKEKDIIFYAVDIDSFKPFIKRFGLQSIPTIILNKNFKEFKRVEGIIMSSALKRLFVDIFKEKTKGNKDGKTE